MIYAATDIETTGLTVGYDEVIEVAVVLFDETKKIIEQYCTYCSSSRPVPPEATAVNGITTKMINDYEHFRHYRPKVEKMINSASKIVGHNIIMFDLPMMRMTADPSKCYDTLIKCREKYPRKEHNLRNMCNFHKIPWDDDKAHGALYDALRAMDLFIELEFGKNLQEEIFVEEIPESKPSKKSFWDRLDEYEKASEPAKTVEDIRIVLPKDRTSPDELLKISDDPNLPRLESGTLVIPLLTPAKYRWWDGGMSVLDILIELGASEEVKIKYCKTQMNFNKKVG